MAEALQARLRKRIHVLDADRLDSELKANADLDALISAIDDAELVLLGEATHGSHEFYRYRTQISLRLIEEKGFNAIAVEADWPDALALDRHVRLRSGHAHRHAHGAAGALTAFQRFPRWMWRNREMLVLLNSLHKRNAALPPQQRTGFYGLDLYSLRSSMQAVVAYLDRIDPDAARRARQRYACFDHLADNPQRYGYESTFGLAADCEDAVVQQLLQMQQQTAALALRSDADEAFFAEQNARVAQNAEAYYRAMFQGRNKSWNLRDTHMAETLEAIRAHLHTRLGRAPRIVVWAHNSHIGDARATEMGDDGQINLGQLVRERSGASCYLLGFTTHAGSVCAASEWDGVAERKTVLPSRPDSFEHLLHSVSAGHFFLPLDFPQLENERKESTPGLGRRLERAIGVIYLPESERLSHYFEADLARQFDGVVHVDTSSPVTPLDEGAPAGEENLVPETFPSGL